MGFFEGVSFSLHHFRSELELIGGEPAHFRFRSLQSSVPMSHPLCHLKAWTREQREPVCGCPCCRCCGWKEAGARQRRRWEASAGRPPGRAAQPARGPLPARLPGALARALRLANRCRRSPSSVPGSLERAKPSRGDGGLRAPGFCRPLPSFRSGGRRRGQRLPQRSREPEGGRTNKTAFFPTRSVDRGNPRSSATANRLTKP